MNRVKQLFDLSGRVAIVTGASSGLGAGFAGALATAGATVVVAARRRDRLEKLAAELAAPTGASPSPGPVIGVECDVTRPEDRQRLVRRALEVSGSIDVLVNNAGRPGPPNAAEDG